MPQENLDDRIRALQAELQPAPMPSAPVSGDNLSPEEVNAALTASGGLPVPNQSTNNAAPPAQPVDDMGNSLPEPTPPDNTLNQIDQKRQQVLESLKADGFTGYTPSVSDAAYWAQDDSRPVAQAVQDIAAGFNVSLARALSLPREVVDRGMSLLGLDYMQHGSPTQQTIDTLNRMGIPTYEVENLANKIGRGALPALATWAAMQVAAPAMAANQGMGVAGHLMREIGQWAVKHPVLGLWLGQTSQAGGKIATNTFGDSPLVEFAGELAGGAAPGAAAFAVGKVPGVKATGRLVGKSVDMLSDALPTPLSNAIKQWNPLYKAPIATPSAEGLINPNFDPNRVQNFAKDQIVAAQTYQDKAIEQAIEAIPRAGSTDQIQTRTHDLLRKAEKISKRIVQGFWDAVPKKTKIPVQDLNDEMVSLQKDLVNLDNQRPDDMLNKIIRQTAPRVNAKGEEVSIKLPVEKLLDFKSQIGTAITEEQARDAPREGIIRNLTRMADKIDDHIAMQLPDNTKIEQARQMSKRHNDLFSRGPINDVLSKRRTGDFRTPPAENIDKLLSKTNGLQALKDVQDGILSYPKPPTTRFQPAAARSPGSMAATPADQAVLDDMIKNAQDSIRAMYRDAADKSPEKAVAFSARNDEELKAIGSVAGELQFSAQKVASALAEKKTIQSSALARFAETSPDKAVANIFAQKDPAETARRLMVSFRGDPDALEGLQNEVLKHFIYNVGKTNPNVLQKMMAEPRIGNMLEAVLSSEQYTRLSRMVKTAVQVGAEDQTSFLQALKYPTKTAGRIIGAFVGRKLSTGTIQTPGIVSKAIGDYVERAFGGTLPDDLLAQAVLDPHWEALLYSRLPTNTKDMKIAQLRYRRIFATINTGQQEIMRKLSDDNEQ